MLQGLWLFSIAAKCVFLLGAVSLKMACWAQPQMTYRLWVKADPVPPIIPMELTLHLPEFFLLFN